MINILLAGAFGLGVTLLGTPALIKFLTKRHYGQFIRQDGPAGHMTKRGTPTMGGIAIVLMVVTLLLKLDRKPSMESLLLETATESQGEGRSRVTEGGLGESGDPAMRGSSWRHACQAIVRTYQLSPRESEVFGLLARGRNAEYIQGKLFISLHTAKSHIANIYQKLGVHSIQEMLDLIDLFTEQ